MLRKLSHLAARRQSSKCPRLIALSLSTPGRPEARARGSRDWEGEFSSLPSLEKPSGRKGPDHRVIAVGSGKGGVGKTVVSSSLALALAETSPGPITAMDVDLGGANLHAGLGIPRPSFALNQFLLDGARLEELWEPSGTEGLRYIGGASDIVGLAEFSNVHRERFLNELRAFREGTTILDLGAGSSLFNLDLFCLADQGVLVTTPEPPAVQNAYGFLRAAVYRKLQLLFDGESGLMDMIDNAKNHRGRDTSRSIPALIHEIDRYNKSAATQLEEVINTIRIGVVVNMCDNLKAGKVAENFAQLARQYLGVRLDILGTISWDDTVRRAICEWRPLLIHYPRAKAARHLRTMANRLLDRLEHSEVLTV